MYQNPDIGVGSSVRPDRPNLSRSSVRTILNSIYNRIAVDVSSIQFYEGIKDKNGNIKKKVDSGLTNALTISANIDETGTMFLSDIVLSMFDEGVIAIIPFECNVDPRYTDSYDIYQMRVAKIKQWYPENVQVEIYNQKTGKFDTIIFPKKATFIIENPFYSVMNQHNSIAQRLSRKLSLMDLTDERSNSGKLDLIIQLPYVIKTKARKDQAEERRTDIENQLQNSSYGIAYTDGTERVIQLNRPVENNLQAQVEYLTKQLYSQLGFSEEILNGTANEQTMLNYYNHTIEPICSAIADEFIRKYLTKTARTQGHTITYFRDPFKLVPINNIAEIADKFTRNEILTSNEVRSIIGFTPSEQSSADVLRNKNINQTPEAMEAEQEEVARIKSEEDSTGNQNGSENFEEDDPMEFVERLRRGEQ